jgi:hypothetical protein
MSDVLDLIGIDGDTFLPSEIFIGLGGASATASTGTDPGTTPAVIELDQALWNGQNSKIESENDYCDQLQKQFKQKQQKISGIRDTLMDIIQEILGEIVGTAVGEAVETAVSVKTGNPLVGKGVGLVANLMTELGLEWGIDWLVGLFTRGNELLMGIQEENALLLTLEKSRDNYEFREAALARHREDIKIVLDQISAAEKTVQIDKSIETMGLIESLIALQYNNEELQLPGNGYLSLRGKYHGGI